MGVYNMHVEVYYMGVYCIMYMGCIRYCMFIIYTLFILLL